MGARRILTEWGTGAKRYRIVGPGRGSDDITFERSTRTDSLGILVWEVVPTYTIHQSIVGDDDGYGPFRSLLVHAVELAEKLERASAGSLGRNIR